MPARATFCVRSASVMVRVAPRAPAAVGVNVMEMMQLDPAPSEVPQLLEAIAKSLGMAPPRATLEMERDEPPVLGNVMFMGALVVVRFWAAKVRLAVDRVSVGGARPVPLTAIVWVPFEALLAICSVALRAPVAVGVKVTLITQLEPGATEEAHPDAAKSPGFAPVKVRG